MNLVEIINHKTFYFLIAKFDIELVYKEWKYDYQGNMFF